MSNAILNIYHCELMKVPKKIRGMSMAQFNEEFGGNIQAASKKEAASAISAIPQTVVRAQKPKAPSTAQVPMVCARKIPLTPTYTLLLVEKGARSLSDSQCSSIRTISACSSSNARTLYIDGRHDPEVQPHGRHDPFHHTRTKARRAYDVLERIATGSHEHV
jgi:hypothetical protein